MKCAKDKCKYYCYHLYQTSYRTCDLEDVSFNADSDKICNIDKIIIEKTETIEMLIRHSQFLKTQ